MSNSINLGAAELLRQFDAGTVSATEYAQEIIKRNAEHSNLNAVACFDPEHLVEVSKRADQQRANGDGDSLCGLPLIVKDNINTTCYPTTGGTGALRDHTPEKNAGVITALLAEGAIVGAMAGMHELAFGITSNNSITGAVRNPHDLTKIAGGSSGGTAAAVAAGIFPIGLGTDTGGSSRIPAALCGVVGFRPTSNRYSNYGIIPISHTRDTAGVIARHVEDVAVLDSVMSKVFEPPKAPDMKDVRLGIPSDVFFENIEDEVEKAVQDQLRHLESAGATLVDVSLDGIWPHNEAFSFPVVFYEVMRDLPAYLKEFAPDISFEKLVDGIGSPDVAGAIASQLGDDAMPEAAYRAAMDVHRPAMRQIYNSVFQENKLTALAFPTTPLRARDIGLDETVDLNGEQLPTFPTYIRNTDLGSNIGVPGISLPCQNVSGLPIGIEFEGLAGRDTDLIGLALAVEDVLSH